jgi:hypothetical protein
VYAIFDMLFFFSSAPAWTRTHNPKVDHFSLKLQKSVPAECALVFCAKSASLWPMDNFDAPQCVRVCPLRAVGRPWVGTYVLLTVIQNPVPQVRLELTTSACLTACTDYKYGALTDCATGARTCIQLPEMGTHTCTVRERTPWVPVPVSGCRQRKRKRHTTERRQHVPLAAKYSNVLAAQALTGLARVVYTDSRDAPLLRLVDPRLTK